MKKVIGLFLVVLFASMFVMSTGALATPWTTPSVSVPKVTTQVVNRDVLYNPANDALAKAIAKKIGQN